MATCLHPTNVHGTLYPCGKCPVCRQNYRQSKGDRFMLAAAFNKKNGGRNFFLTLTYNDEALCWALPPNKHSGEWYPCFEPKHLKNLFKFLRDDRGFHFRYFVCCEYGTETHRPHYHMILLMKEDVSLQELSCILGAYWNERYGFIQCATLNDKRVQYAAKYVLKDDMYYVGLCNDEGERYKWDVRKPWTRISNGFGIDAIPFLNEYIHNDGNIREKFVFDSKSVTFDAYIKNHIDPSLKAELQASYEANKKEIQKGLALSRRIHSKEVDDGLGGTYLKKDFSRDMEIYKHRLQLKKLKRKQV